MENDITLSRVNKAIQTIEKHQVKRDYQKLDEILPLALTVLKYHAKDIEAVENNEKYYVPAWIDTLLNRLSDDQQPLDNIDYAVYSSQAASLTKDDFKPASIGIFGYSVKYMTSKEVSETILALKKYFKLI